MAFVKTHWVDDSEPAITAAQLNRIEDGIAEAGESSKAIVLTQAEYDALSDEEKDSDNVYYISDAPFESSNVVPLTRAEYDALSDATKMDGRFYYITDEEEVAKSFVVQTNVNSTETVPSSAVVYGLNEDITDALSEHSSARITVVDETNYKMPDQHNTYVRHGKVVTLTFLLAVISPSNDWTVFGSVPSEIAPKIDLYANLSSIDTGNNPMSIWIATNGSIYGYRGTTNSKASYRGIITYGI